MPLVHRCRFVEYQPQPVHCLAYESPARDVQRIAVARADASIEIWNVTNDWHQERIIPGGKNKSVEALIWGSGRLFSAGLHAQITEWDIDTLTAKQTVGSFGGAVWCLALNNAGTCLAAGCEDGSVKLFEVQDDLLLYLKSLDRQASRILSVAWHSSGGFLASGDSSSTIRLWNMETGRNALRITVQDESKGNTLIWALAILDDMTIVSGDSRGATQFWNGKFGTLKQSFDQHAADVLVIGVAPDQRTLYSSGVDHKVIQFTYTEGSDDQPSKWILTGRRREHSHDVRAIAVSTDGIMVTGGVDTNLILYNVVDDSFGASGTSHRKIPPFPHKPLLSIAEEADCVVAAHGNKVDIWRLGTVSETGDDSLSSVGIENYTSGHRMPVGNSPQLMLQLQAKTADQITVAAISRDSSFVAYSNCERTSVFALILTDSGDVLVSKLKGLSMQPAHALHFNSNNTKLIILTNTGDIQIVDLAAAETFTLEPPETDDTGCHVSTMAVSNDSQWIAATTGKLIHIYNVDTLQYHGTLPALAAQHTAMAFRGLTPELIVTTVNNEIYIFNVEDLVFTEWSKNNSTRLPKQWIARREKVVGIVSNPSDPNAILIYDHAGLVVLHLDRPLPSPGSSLFQAGHNNQSQSQGGKKRKKGQSPYKMKGKGGQNYKKIDGKEEIRQVSCRNFQLVKRYQPLLYIGFSQHESMVVIERPWLSIMENFPAPLHRARYGI